MFVIAALTVTTVVVGTLGYLTLDAGVSKPLTLALISIIAAAILSVIAFSSAITP